MIPAEERTFIRNVPETDEQIANRLGFYTVQAFLDWKQSKTQLSLAEQHQMLLREHHNVVAKLAKLEKILDANVKALNCLVPIEGQTP